MEKRFPSSVPGFEWTDRSDDYALLIEQRTHTAATIDSLLILGMIKRKRGSDHLWLSYVPVNGVAMRCLDEARFNVAKEKVEDEVLGTDKTPITRKAFYAWFWK